MNGQGRPFRFLAIVIAAWTGARIAVLWPGIDNPDDLVRTAVPVAERIAPQRTVAAAVPVPPPPVAFTLAPSPGHAPAGGRISPSNPGLAANDFDPRTLALLSLVSFGTPETPGETFGAPLVVPRSVFARDVAAASRWSASVWLLARDGGGRAAVGGPLLGGGQAGGRVTYALTPSLAAVGRVSAPLTGRGKEAAVGIEWRPGPLPIRLVAEHRFAIDGGRGAPVIGAIGGVDAIPVAAGFRIAGYAQAGLIARDGVSGFVDAIVRVTRPIVERPIVVDAGAGVWASAQRGARRLDIGPTAGVTLPVTGAPLRITADWRERIAGDARPTSGPAMTIGIDF